MIPANEVPPRTKPKQNLNGDIFNYGKGQGKRSIIRGTNNTETQKRAEGFSLSRR